MFVKLPVAIFRLVFHFGLLLLSILLFHLLPLLVGVLLVVVLLAIRLAFVRLVVNIVCVLRAFLQFLSLAEQEARGHVEVILHTILEVGRSAAI